ncbi:LLM class flavin-dependent oxidoreductase [Actinosynnema sp. ALI-1.44]|uniref:LLM class flavin-dependent oxidoreductase n=1 Tax=Actinosynnema sp. ALI-1.44 TaxID=1933779 RepID=UPI001EDA1B49|nr:LLM class flavin-dependent oxidoreductase [Actinosynnema sp. ALI-1.44]
MDIGVGLPTTVPGADGRQLVEFARRAEHNGFHTLAVIDRLVYDSYDSIVALAAAAAATERITLATTILLAGYRPSVAELGKQLASVDRLSGGRLVVGVAAGGREDDFQATGVPYHTRGRRLDQLLTELQRVWAGQGEVPGIGPRPVNGQIPVWVGGHSPAALSRAARHGIGWISPGGSAAAYPELVAKAKAVFAEEGRTDVPRMAAMTYVALGDDRGQRAAQYLLDYYSYLGPKAQFLAGAVIADEARLRGTIDGYAAAGCDELLLFPCTADVGQLDLIAKVALP